MNFAPCDRATHIILAGSFTPSLQDTMMPPERPTRPDRPAPVQRAVQLIARLRHRQLDLARQGKVDASARYADRAGRLRERVPCV